MGKFIIRLLFIALILLTICEARSYGTVNSSSNNYLLNDSDVIAEVNKRALLIDNIHSEGEIAIKTSTIDESGSIEIKVKKPNDIWYRIYGSFAFISKDAFIGHFTQKNFVYVNNLNETIIEGKTTDTNIGYITRIRCSYDDIMNVMSGICYITVLEQDTISSEDDPTFYLITVKSENKTKNTGYKKMIIQ